MALRKAYDCHFERVWKSFPRKVAKGAAAKAFDKLKLTVDEVEELIAHIEERKRYDKYWQDGVICHLSTFLNQERWNDDYPRVRRGEGTGRGGAVSEDDETSMRKFWQGVAARGGDVPDKYRHLLGGPVH